MEVVDKLLITQIAWIVSLALTLIGVAILHELNSAKIKHQKNRINALESQIDNMQEIQTEIIKERLKNLIK